MAPYSSPQETDEDRLKMRRRAFWRDILAGFAAAVGIAIAVYAWAGVQNAQENNTADILTTCQTGNRTRPQLAINQMVGIDGILTLNPKITIDVRRQVAAAYIHALEPELAPGRSIGFRDCNDDGRIDRADFLADEAPPDGWQKGVPELLGPDAIPHVEAP